MFGKIRLKLTLFYAAVMALLVIILIFGAHKSIEWSILSEQEETVRAFAEEEAVEHAIFLQHEILDENMTSMDQEHLEDESRRRQMFFYVFDQQGKMINHASSQKDMEETILEKIRQWNVSVDEVVTMEAKKNHQIMMKAQPIMINGERAGTVYVGRDITPVLKTMRNATIYLGIFGAIALVFAIGAGYFMAKRAMLPLRIAYEKQQQFAADASHELRTPLSVLLSSLDVFKYCRGQSEDLFSQHILDDMRDEIRKMTELIDDLLLIARSDEREGLGIHCEEFDLTQAVEEVAQKLSSSGKAKELDIAVRVEPKLRVCGDRKKLERLVLILLDNAAKYTPQNGEIMIEAKKGSGSKSVEISVSDTGVGIGKEDLSKIFDRFYQADKSRSDGERGSGLGLSIAQEIVQAHQGRIEVKSELGKGSIFIVDLPILI